MIEFAVRWQQGGRQNGGLRSSIQQDAMKSHSNFGVRTIGWMD